MTTDQSLTVELIRIFYGEASKLSQGVARLGKRFSVLGKREISWVLRYLVLGLLGCLVTQFLERRFLFVRLITGAKLFLVEKINSFVELSKIYSRVSCMNCSAVLVWRKSSLVTFGTSDDGGLQVNLHIPGCLISDKQNHIKEP